MTAEIAAAIVAIVDLCLTRHLGDDNAEKGLYRHPSRQGLNLEAEYKMQHGVYSLGVCLLEIGNIAICLNFGAGHLLLPAREKLSSCMGDEYADVAQTCFTYLDPDNNNFVDQSEFGDEDDIQVGVRYIEKVLIQLNI
ncbi:hypothetical protein CEP54_003647 [Fusarium duplospermum]|uniref:EF-hand domain-containing protein n=1 Tax=Fusarium duplospermum TaxID=1325734 RepID=A0A428QMN3_9HYPO|nr:hypothetical protein CEP54_003647 [Fusarium duplospermum]